ncbi:type II secretion system protein [Planctomicrobium sp. SH664]|uniref:type II secretion system protein n=1 Tax=Planctomicrobium sp. SH664 TaxID=3448125 RepID=UPI003F5BF46D
MQRSSFISHRRQSRLTRQRLIATNRRSGFSLIELMVVIIVIAILASLLFPAINSARISARNAAVTVEIKNLEKAIADFKLKFGVEPPSSIVLCEQGSDWGDTDLPTREAKAFILQAWPNFNFAINRDINGDGDDDDKITLNGSECLVFFLGGVCATDFIDQNGVASGAGNPSTWAPLGFSTNPADPFRRGGQRHGPYFEFDPARMCNEFFKDTETYMPEYRDPLPGQLKPYLFASSNEGRGYNLFPSPDTRNPDLQTDASNFLNTYKQPVTNLAFNAKTYQIISPGRDGEYGAGGTFDPQNPKGQLSGARNVEQDNITNFHPGPLAP